MILAPNGQIPGAYPSEIGYSYGPDGTYLCPDDPSFNTKAEAGFYYDTQLGSTTHGKPTLAQRFATWKARRVAKKALGLGSIPTDAELASIYGYTPVNSGWIASSQGYYTGPYVPPNGWRPAPGFGPPTSLNGLRDVAPAPAAPTSATDVLQALNDHNAKVLAFTAAGTVIAGIAAMLTIVRTVKLLREDG